MKSGGKIDPNNGIPFFFRKIFDRRNMLNTSVIYEHIDGSEFRNSLLYHFAQGGRLQHISSGKHIFYAVLGGSFLGNFATIFFQAIKNYVVAFSSKRFGNAQANAAGAA